MRKCGICEYREACSGGSRARAYALTGDYQADFVGNRTRRMWTDPTGQRAAKNTEPMLLQTYARDTGEILSEMNMPIVVEGRVWGNIRIGIDSQVLLEL